MGRTGINFACAHSDTNGPEQDTNFTSKTVGHGRKSMQADYCLRCTPSPRCPAPQPGCVLLYIVSRVSREFGGNRILLIGQNGMDD